MSFPTKKDLEIRNFIKGYKEKISEAFDSIEFDEFEKIALLLERSIKNGNKVFSCGNGGSSSISEHLVCDFVKGTSNETNIQPIVHSLTSNISLITAIANDVSYEEIFSYQLEKYAQSRDILIAISSSGNSPNIIKGIQCARALGLQTISFVGFDGGMAKNLTDYSIHINIDNYGICEDVHQSLMHILSQYLRLANLDNLEQLDRKIF
jgi:D-sedoheptulose 7-phosphate isomerase